MRVLLLPTAILSLTGMDGAHTMSNYLWNYRPLLVFAGNERSLPLAEQRRAVAGSASELGERNVVVIWVVANEVAAEFGPALKMSAAELRARYAVTPNSFRVMLVGKDGGVKLSSDKPIDTAALMATIDTMPMRRDEMRGR